MILARIALTWLATSILASGAQDVARNSIQPPNEDLYIYQPIPNIRINPTRTPAVRLSELWGDRPLLITLVFTRCAGVCYPFLQSLRSAADSLRESRSGYRVLVLSFDWRDTPADLESAAAGIGVAGNDRWIFATASDDSIHALAKATGFWFQWDADRRQFDHPAVLLAVNRGRLIRLFTGARISPNILGGVLRELEGGFVASYPLPGEALFRCFQFDAASRSYSLDWGALLLVLPGIIAFLSILLTFRATRINRR